MKTMSQHRREFEVYITAELSRALLNIKDVGKRMIQDGRLNGREAADMVNGILGGLSGAASEFMKEHGGKPGMPPGDMFNQNK